MRVIDLHCDTIDRLAMGAWEPYRSMDNPARPGDTLTHNKGSLSFDRLEGVQWCQCTAIWVPDDLDSKQSLDFYRTARDWFAAHVVQESSTIAQARSFAEIPVILESGKKGVVLAVEGGSPIGEDLGIIDEMAADGVRLLTLTWNGPNTIASGHDTHEGISAFGRTAVRKLEDAGIVVDVSHLNDEGFEDLLKIARKPFIATHSNARSVCSHVRNLTDRQFEAIRDRGGLVGINYYIGFVKDDEDGTLTIDDVTFDDLSRHVDHFLSLGGEDVIALGSDYDGAEVPTFLEGCEKIPAFYQSFCQRFGEGLAEKVFSANALAFFERYEG